MESRFTTGYFGPLPFHDVGVVSTDPLRVNRNVSGLPPKGVVSCCAERTVIP